jgi:hypothetical protein
MSIVGLLLVAQAAVPLTAAPSDGVLPDIEIRASANIRSLEIRSRGQARLELRADPGVAPPVEVERSAPAERTRYRNLRIEMRGIARLTAPTPIATINATTTGETE